MKYSLRISGVHHNMLRSHLFPGDGSEAVALLLCGVRAGESKHTHCVQEVLCIPYEQCNRKLDSVTWDTKHAETLLLECKKGNSVILKAHSHPGEYDNFSKLDDESDRNFFEGVDSFLDDERAHGSIVLTAEGNVFGRTVRGGVFTPLSKITIVGDDIHIFEAEPSSGKTQDWMLRNAQAFGKGTTEMLASQCAAVIGCSGTGSIIAELLHRLGIGRLLLIDPEAIEDKNLNRILNSKMSDARSGRLKVKMLKDAYEAAGLGCEVVALDTDLLCRETVLQIAECDFVFGCTDSVSARHHLNKLCSFYCLPYFDVGVKLVADLKGGIENIAGAIHYIQPGGSSLLSRGLYRMRQVEAEDLKKYQPELYAQQRKAGYIDGIDEDRPNVIAVNMLASSLLALDFLARIHSSYRNMQNRDFAAQTFGLSEYIFERRPEGKPCEVMRRYLGQGDVEPLLKNSYLSATNAQS